MATQPKPAPKPEPKPAPKPEPTKPEPKPAPEPAPPQAATDPQQAKFEAHAVPPLWQDPKAVRPNAPAPPPDGVSSADEQRARAADAEAHGFAPTDQRPPGDRPRFQKDALAGGGAFISAGRQEQVPGVTPPTKRE